MTLASPIRWVQPSAESTAAPEAARPGEWSELAAIERVSRELELTARSQAFVGGLAARRPAGATLAPLHGGRSLDAPHGLVRGIARVVDGGRRDGPELVPAPPVRARRRGAAVADQSTVANELSLATEQEAEAEPASAPTDVGPGAADLPEPRPRVVQAVTRFAVPGAREVTALTRAADVVLEPPAGRISRAPLVPDRSEAHVTEADTSVAVASATHDTSSVGRSPGPPLSEFLPRRIRGRSAPQPARVEPEPEPELEPHPGPEPAGPTESDVVEASSVDSEPAGHLGTPEPLQVTSVVTAARSLAARSVTSAEEASSELTADVMPRAPADTSTRGPSELAPRPVTATPAPAIRRSETRAGAVPAAEAEMDAGAVEAAAVTSRSGAAAAAAPPEERGSFELSPATAHPPAPAQPSPSDSPTGGGEVPTTPAQRVSRAAEVQQRATEPRERGAVEVPAAVRGKGVAARVVRRHETQTGAPPHERTASEPDTAKGEEPTPAPVVDAPAAAPAPKAHADSGAQVAPAPTTRSSSPARRAGTTAVRRKATPHEPQAATPREPIAPEARSDAREPVTRARAAESPFPAHETRSRAGLSTAAGVQRQAAAQPREPEARAPAQPSAAAGVRRQATAQLDEPVALETRTDTREPVTRARAVESPVPAPEPRQRTRESTAATVRRQAAAQPGERAASEAAAENPERVIPAHAVESPPPAPEERQQTRPSTAVEVRRHATALPREQAVSETAAETPERVIQARAVESPPPAPEARPQTRASIAAEVRRQATAQPGGRAASEAAAEAPAPVSPTRAVESRPTAQRTRSHAQAATEVDVQRQAAEQRHDHVVAETSAEARNPVVSSTVADAPVPASEARVDGNADATTESSTRRVVPARPTATGADVQRRAKTPHVQPRRHDAVDVPAGTREPAVESRIADIATAAELTVSPTLEPPTPTRPAPAVRDHGDTPRAAHRETPLQARRPGLDLHAVLSPSDVSRRSAVPAASIQRVPQTGGAEQVARLPGLDVQPRRSTPLPEAATALPFAVGEQTPRASLQLAPSPPRLEPAASAAHLPVPAMPVALQTPTDPPASVQRMKSVADPERDARERLSEAPDDELEELADRLYDRIRTRFRSELLIDRERAGLLADRY